MELKSAIKNTVKNVIGEENWTSLKRIVSDSSFSRVEDPRAAIPRGQVNKEMRENWEKNGYLALPGFFSNHRISETNEYIERVLKKQLSESDRLVVDIFLGGKDEQRVLLKDAPDNAFIEPFKLNDLYLESDLIRRLILDEKLTEILGELVGGSPAVCNTLNFAYGSEQRFHTDSLYMTPPKDQNLIATWIALEDCLPEAGPLQYYPGSHRIPAFHFSSGRMTAIGREMDGYHSYMEKEVLRLNLKPETFCAKRGDVFIWHCQLYHGGSPIQDRGKTRKSLVTHYFKANEIAGELSSLGPFRYYLKRNHQPVPVKSHTN